MVHSRSTVSWIIYTYPIFDNSSTVLVCLIFLSFSPHFSSSELGFDFRVGSCMKPKSGTSIASSADHKSSPENFHKSDFFEPRQERAAFLNLAK